MIPAIIKLFSVNVDFVFKISAGSFRNSIVVLLYMAILFIPSLYGQVFERKCQNFKKLNCYCRSEKMK